jgi:hypothetical protein
LTKEWADWIDYWAVDFDFENRKEILRLTQSGGTEQEVPSRFGLEFDECGLRQG